MNEEPAYMACTICGRDTPVTSDQVTEMFPHARSRRRRIKLIAAVCREWRCDECLDEEEAARPPEAETPRP